MAAHLILAIMDDRKVWTGAAKDRRPSDPRDRG
jgi:hypothetical protein